MMTEQNQDMPAPRTTPRGYEMRMKTSEVSKTSDVWKAFQSAREETLSVTEEAVRVEKEIDERVKMLYGV